MSAPTQGIVLVTGSTDGLGRNLVAELHRRGWTVHAHGRNPAKLAALAADLPGVTTWTADLASLVEVRRLAERVAAAVPRLNVLVNNAAVGFGPPGGQRQTSRDGHELRLAVNYLAPVLLTRSLRPLLAKAAPARVVQVGSAGQAEFDVDDIEFEHGYDGVEAYRRAKLALVTYTLDTSDELKAGGICVNCVHPASFMDTAMVRQSGIRPLSAVADGTRAVLRLITDPALADLSGQFLNGTSVGPALPKVYDPDFRRALRDATNRLLAGTGSS